MSDVCREFGISRKAGYKIFNRYRDEGLEALTDRFRRAARYANQLPEPVEAMIISCKKNKPHWGVRKTRELLVKRVACDLRLTSKSTVRAVRDQPYRKRYCQTIFGVPTSRVSSSSVTADAVTR
jgi:transposase